MCFFLEAPPGIGPGIKVLQTSALPLGYGAILWLGSTSMVGLQHYINRISCDIPIIENKRARIIFVPVISGADYGDRTRHLNLGKVALYQMS